MGYEIVSRYALIALSLICMYYHFTAFSKMTTRYFSLNPFTTDDSILTEEAATHIVDRHLIRTPSVKKALFCTTFPLEETLQRVGWYTWEKPSPFAVLLDQGFKDHHGTYRLYMFDMDRHVGWDPEGFPTTKLAVYYSERVKGDKWHIITAYPWTFAYHCFFYSKRNKPCTLTL